MKSDKKKGIELKELVSAFLYNLGREKDRPAIQWNVRDIVPSKHNPKKKIKI